MILQNKLKNSFNLSNLSEYVKIDKIKKTKNITIQIDDFLVLNEKNIGMTEFCLENYYN